MAHLTFRGLRACLFIATLAGCASTGGPGAVPPDSNGTRPVFHAFGNEPSWGLDLVSEVRLETLSRNTATHWRRSENFKALGGPAAVTAPRVEAIRGGRRYVAKSAAVRLVVTVLDRPCTDVMSGMPYPNAVTVVVHGRTYRGCGGEPASLLRAGEWMVEAIDGAPLAPGSRATIRFGSDGRVSGDASCNTYSDRYTLADEGLYLSNPIATRKACAPSLMTQEGRFMEVLRNVQRFEIAPDGALVLHAGEEHSIRARR